MDALSEAMRAVRVTGALFFNGEFAAPWRFATPAQDQIGPKISPDSERLVLFHLVTDGHATARTAGHDEVSLAAGDIIVFPHGDAHEMWHGRTSKLFPGTRLLPKLAKGELAAEKWGGNGPVTRIICGYLGCERHAEGLFLSGLPAILKTNVRSSPAGAWIESAIRHCVSDLELQQAGRLAVLAKLAETLFVETLCRYMDELPPERTGWLAGARDAKVGQALALLHREPAPTTLVTSRKQHSAAPSGARSARHQRDTDGSGRPSNRRPQPQPDPNECHGNQLLPEAPINYLEPNSKRTKGHIVYTPLLPVLEGPPPWPTERIEYVALRNLRHVQDRLENHPGRPIHEQFDSIQSVLRLFNKSATAFLANVERFHVEAHTNNLLRRTRSDDRRKLAEEIQEQLYIFTSCAATLSDQTRKLSESVDIPGYTAKKNATFAENPLHRFVHALRVDVVHLTFHKPGWQLIAGDPNESTIFFLHPSQMRRAKEYHTLAKHYLSQNPQVVNLGLMVASYQALANGFHDWLRTALHTAHGETIRDYERTARLIRAVGFRVSWRLILSQIVIQGNRDPYQYLDRYLTASELEEVLMLSHRSKQQVDRIIRFIDEDGACDDEIRTLVYDAFGVENP